MMPSGHKAFLVSNTKDVELLLMHNRTYAAEYVSPTYHGRRIIGKLAVGQRIGMLIENV